MLWELQTIEAVGKRCSLVVVFPPLQQSECDAHAAAVFGALGVTAQLPPTRNAKGRLIALAFGANGAPMARLLPPGQCIGVRDCALSRQAPCQRPPDLSGPTTN